MIDLPLVKRIALATERGHLAVIPRSLLSELVKEVETPGSVLVHRAPGPVMREAAIVGAVSAAIAA